MECNLLTLLSIEYLLLDDIISIGFLVSILNMVFPFVLLLNLFATQTNHSIQSMIRINSVRSTPTDFRDTFLAYDWLPVNKVRAFRGHYHPLHLAGFTSDPVIFSASHFGIPFIKKRVY
jgi:hypothetical protein